MGMIDSINWWRSLRRNANFWDWMKDTYTGGELQRLAAEATDSSFINPYDPTADLTLGKQERDETLRRKTTRRLYRRYGEEIWSICLGAGGTTQIVAPPAYSALVNSTWLSKCTSPNSSRSSWFATPSNTRRVRSSRSQDKR
jgi:hypothetical protein